MAERNFFGRLRDTAANRIAPGNVVDERGNYLHNGGRAALATALKFGANMFFPGAGMIVDKIAAPWVNRGANYGIGAVQPEGIPVYGAPGSAQGAYAAPPSPTPNLGLGAQTPGNSWAGYMQGQGSVNNFGNQQFGTGMSGIPGGWSPQSTWGQSVAEGQGSNLNFGNYSPGASAGRGGGSSGGSRGGGFGVSSPGFAQNRDAKAAFLSRSSS